MPKFYLTEEFATRATCPDDKQQILYWDHPRALDGRIRRGAQTGLALRVTKSGSRSFVHTYHYNGDRRRQVIGKADTMTVEAARLSIQARLITIEDDIDPDADWVRQTKRHSITLNDLIETFAEQRLSMVSEKHRQNFFRVIAPWLAAPRKTKTRRGLNMKRKVESFGEQFGKLPAEQIKPMDVAEFLTRFESPSVSNSTLKYIKALFNWGIKMQIIDMRNPCTPIDPKKIIKRRPNYTPEDVANIAAWVFKPPIAVAPSLPQLEGPEKRNAALARGKITQHNDGMNELCNFLGILMLTMARPMELRHAKFEHFDLQRLIWHKHNTKGLKLSKATYEYEYRSVPIHRRLVSIIEGQKARWPNSDFVFPCHTDMGKPRDNFAKFIKRFRELDGVPEHFQMYDIKRMSISLMLAGQGIRREDVSHYVDHKGNIETTMIYDLGFVDPLRPVTEKLGELLGV